MLVVPTALFRRLGYFQGFSSEVDRYLGELFSPEHIELSPPRRGRAGPEFQATDSLRDLPPLATASGARPCCNTPAAAGQGEGRLHRKHSVGIGGHISACDAAADGGNPYEEGMRREFEEEVAIHTPYTARCVGLINDDQTDVGRVHLGVVHIFDVEQPAVQPREPEIIDCGFRPVEEILADMNGFETWSEICMKALFGKSP